MLWKLEEPHEVISLEIYVMDTRGASLGDLYGNIYYGYSIEEPLAVVSVGNIC